MPELHRPSSIKHFVAYAVLLGLTLLTVYLSYHKHGFLMAVTVALGIAFTKSSLVGELFMHLRKEKPAIFWILLLTLILFLSLLLLPFFDVIDQARTNALPF